MNYETIHNNLSPQSSASSLNWHSVIKTLRSKLLKIMSWNYWRTAWKEADATKYSTKLRSTQSAQSHHRPPEKLRLEIQCLFSTIPRLMQTPQRFLGSPRVSLFLRRWTSSNYKPQIRASGNVADRFLSFFPSPALVAVIRWLDGHPAVRQIEK